MADNRHWRMRLKRAREDKGWTIDQLAKLAGVAKGQISMLENGQRDFVQKTLSKLLNELGLDYSDLFCGCSEKKRRSDPAHFDHRKVRAKHKNVVPITSKKSA